jgi:hypothetical protein
LTELPRLDIYTPLILGKENESFKFSQVRESSR